MSETEGERNKKKKRIKKQKKISGSKREQEERVNELRIHMNAPILVEIG